MKNIFRKFTPMLMAALAVVALAGCAADDEDFTPGTADNGAYLYASSTNVTYGPDDQQVLKINVGRMDSTTEQTFNLSGDNDAFRQSVSQQVRQAKRLTSHSLCRSVSRRLLISHCLLTRRVTMVSILCA